MKHLCLPQADRRQKYLLRLGGAVQCRPFRSAQLGAPGEPPEPYVGIEQNPQRAASKSSSFKTDSPAVACTRPPSARSCSQGLSPSSGPPAGSRRATVLPRRWIVTG